MTRCTACGDVHDADATTCPRLRVSVTAGVCGTRIERYDIERFVGGGGFGAVYLARHAVLGQAVAIKLLRREVATNTDVVARFLREARAAASIDSPHVVRVSDFGTTSDGVAFYVMEMLAGRDLDALLHEGALPVPRAVDLALQALEGLAAAHAAGVIHRDVKPANIVLAMERGHGSDRDHVKVVDFGLSKVSLAGGAQQLTLTGAMIGTPHYMPPEQFRGARDIDARADIYAMGVVLYQMLSGALPYDAPTYQQLLLKICIEPPRPLRDAAPMLPTAIVEVVERAMAADPDQRFQSARALAEALRGAFAASSSPHAPPRAAASMAFAPTQAVSVAGAYAPTIPAPEPVALPLPAPLGVTAPLHDAPLHRAQQASAQQASAQQAGLPPAADQATRSAAYAPAQPSRVAAADAYADSQRAPTWRAGPLAWFAALTLLLLGLGVAAWVAVPRLLALRPTAPIPPAPAVLAPSSVATSPPGAAMGGPASPLLAPPVVAAPTTLDPGAALVAMKFDAGVPIAAAQIFTLDLTQMPGMDPSTASAMRGMYGGELTVTQLGPTRGSESLIVHATVTGGAGLDTRPIAAALERLGASLASCRAPSGSTRIDVNIARPPGAGLIVVPSQRGDVQDAEALRCVSRALDAIDFAPLLPARTMTAVALELELPLR